MCDSFIYKLSKAVLLSLIFQIYIELTHELQNGRNESTMAMIDHI